MNTTIRVVFLIGLLLGGNVSVSVAQVNNTQQQFEFASFALPENGRIVVPVAEGDSLSGIAATLDAQTNGAISIAAAESEFTGKKSSTLTMLGVAPYSRIDLIGVGSDVVDRVAAEDFGGNAAELLGDTEGGVVNILWPNENVSENASAARVALGYRLRSYRFDRHKEEPVDESTLPIIKLHSDDGSESAFSDDLAHLAQGVFFARDMSSEPANVIYPRPQKRQN